MIELFVNKLLSAGIQIIIFSLPPVIWWLVTDRRKISFFAWIGIQKVDARDKELWKHVSFTVAGFVVLSVCMLLMVRGVKTAASDFSGMGMKALPAALVYAFLNTALPEEILFRGFLLKRLSVRFGFASANIIQSLLFGLLHGIMFVPLTGALKAVLIIVFTGTIGWCMGYVNEQKAKGSILPSWLIHGIANTFSAIAAMTSKI